jgi:hypothetical protein
MHCAGWDVEQGSEQGENRKIPVTELWLLRSGAVTIPVAAFPSKCQILLDIDSTRQTAGLGGLRLFVTSGNEQLKGD